MSSGDPTLVDVVVPVRNGERTVVRAIESVLAQTMARLRVFVVDDGSTDRTPDVVERAVTDDRLTLTRVAHGGVSAARNTGAAAGRAPRLAFLDADDEVLPRWLEELTADPAADLVRCASYRRMVGRPDQVVDADESAPLLAGSFVVARSLFEAVGGYDERLGYSENTDLQLRLRPVLAARHGRVRVVPTPLLVRHVDGADRAGKYGNAALRDAAELLLEKHRAVLGRPATASFSAVAGVNSLRLGERARARRHLGAAIRLAPTRWRYGVRYLQTFVPVPTRRVAR